eukprot:2561332-Amphidinium_carterae.1
MQYSEKRTVKQLYLAVPSAYLQTVCECRKRSKELDTRSCTIVFAFDPSDRLGHFSSDSGLQRLTGQGHCNTICVRLRSSVPPPPTQSAQKIRSKYLGLEQGGCAKSMRTKTPNCITVYWWGGLAPLSVPADLHGRVWRVLSACTELRRKLSAVVEPELLNRATPLYHALPPIENTNYRHSLTVHVHCPSKDSCGHFA